MPRSMQFFENTYPSDAETETEFRSDLDVFDETVHQYYDLRNADRPVDAFSDQIASAAVDHGVLSKSVLPLAKAQHFRLDQ